MRFYLFADYNYGIKLCQRSNDETLIMFNARNELDQSRFVDDLGESIAEMDEMENIKAHNIVETIHFKYLERLRRHSIMHNNNSVENSANNLDNQQQNSRLFNKMINKSCDIRITNNPKQEVPVEVEEEEDDDETADNLKNNEAEKLDQLGEVESNHKQVLSTPPATATLEPVPLD